MAGDLAAEGGAVLAHRRLKKAWPTRLTTTCPRPRRPCRDRSAGADVVEDRSRQAPWRASGFASRAVRKSPSTKSPRVVDEEAAVGVAVPGDPEVGALGEDPVDDELAVLGQQRVRLVVGELAVGVPVGLDQVEAEPLEQRPGHRARHAVAAVDDHLQRLTLAGSIERERVAAGSRRRRRSPRPTRRRAASPRSPSRTRSRISPMPGIAGERQRALADELDPGVGLRVVRGGDHRPAVEPASSRRGNRASRCRPSRRRRRRRPRRRSRRAVGRPSPAPAGACRARARPADRRPACRERRRARGRTRGRSGRLISPSISEP